MKKAPRWLAAVRGHSLRVRLVVILALALAPPACFGIWEAYSDYLDERHSVEQNLLQTAQLLTVEHQNLIAGAQKVLAALAGQDDVRKGSPAACRLALRNALYQLPEYQLAVVVDPKGKIRCASRDIPAPISLAGESWFQSVIHGQEFVISGLVRSPLSSQRTIIAAVPLHDADGRISGAVSVHIALTTLAQLPNVESWPPQAFLAIADTKGTILPLGNAALPPFPLPVPADLIRSAVKQNVSITNHVDDAGRRFVLAVATLPPSNLYAVLGMPAESLFGWLWLKLLAGLATPILIWIAAVATAWMAAHRLVVRWILKLRRLSRSYIAGGQVDRNVQMEDAPDELRELGNSLVQLMDAIDARDAQLNEAITHRETLIKEIHHRVKNNLQIVSSLLNLQTRSLQDGAAREAVVGMRSRITALALVHKSLYETNELQLVELDEFLQALCRQLQELVAIENRQIAVVTQIPHFSISAETAVTLAMLITEAVTNAIKHAFVGRQRGRVAVKIERSDGGAVELTIADDGVGGFAAAVADRAGQSHALGHELMEGYVRQLGGTMVVEESDGTAVRIIFRRLR